MDELELIAVTTVGLESVVRRELEALGYAARIEQVGRVVFGGDESALCRANLWLRSADRVLLRVGAFEARDFGELFDRTYALPWEQWIGPMAAFPVRGRSVKSQLSSVPACQRIVKKAVVEKLRAAHRVERLPETGPTCTVEVALLTDQATLTIDTTGAGLNKRGYRRLVGEAPLKETLAAAMVMLSFWRPDRPLIDPFCGTGTIPIEAAMIGRDLAPGLGRSFAAESWPAISASRWEAARGEARDRARGDLPVKIIGTDVDAEALRLARIHAAEAGVEGQVHFQQRAFDGLSSKQQYGCVICNPPYGERLSDRAEVDALYRAIPLVLRRLDTWSHYVLTARKDFEQLVGRPADRRRKLYNGRIECTYYQFHGPKRPPGGEQPFPRGSSLENRAPGLLPDSPKPAFGELGAQAAGQAEIFRNRLRRQARHLRKWPARGVTCYRLYDRDIPEVPLVIDVYDRRLRLAEYDRPHDRTAAQHANWLDLMVRTAAEAMGVRRDEVFVTFRRPQLGPGQCEPRAGQGCAFIVTEAGLKFHVNLSDDLGTGLSLDRRVVRSMVRDAAAGMRMLNLFADTGAFTVYAAAGGAKSTTTVELSNTYLQWSGRNMALNGFAGDEHRFVCSDAMTFLRRCDRRALWDLAVVAPPMLANSNVTDRDWDLQRDHVELLTGLTERITPGGVIYFSTRSRRFKLDEQALEGLETREISRQTVPQDFRNKRIHRCWRLVRTGVPGTSRCTPDVP